MTGLLVALGALTGWLAVPVPGEQARLKSGQHRSQRPWTRWAVIAGGLAAPVLGGLVIGGLRGGVLGVIAALVGVTGWRLVGRRWRHRAAGQRRAQVAQAAQALAGELSIGRVPAEALHVVGVDFPVLQGVSATLELGGDVGEALRLAAKEPGCRGLLALARAWEVSERTGAPMVRSLESVAEALCYEKSVAATVAGELAAPRATGRLLAGLPLAGLGLGYVLGGDPVAFLLSNPVGWGCLVLGVALACAGLLWSERIADEAAAER